jgi:hypothetical protein
MERRPAPVTFEITERLEENLEKERMDIADPKLA